MSPQLHMAIVDSMAGYQLVITVYTPALGLNIISDILLLLLLTE